jgi:hypothetical protein
LQNAPDRAWTYNELYSIYTASHQGGLLACDVDGDGLADLFIGNYWMRNPGRWELPWRLFNMNTFFDKPDSALARFALYQRPGRALPDLIWAESEAAPARLALLERPADVREPWPPQMITPAPDHPRALLVIEQPAIAGKAAWPLLLVGADDGVRAYSHDDGRWSMRLVWKGAAVIALFKARGGVVAVTGEGVVRIATHDYVGH